MEFKLLAKTNLPNTKKGIDLDKFPPTGSTKTLHEEPTRVYATGM
ncbi:MAG: hypothetical protein SNF68_07865 [Rikenellaceae bacterium]